METPAQRPKPVLLLVEDDQDDVYFFERALMKSGAPYAIHHAEDGSAAINFVQKALAEDYLPEIVFLDLKMPVLNGFDVLDWMKRQTFPRPIPVVVLSGSEQPHDKERARQLGAIDYLVKPIKPEDLVRLLDLVSVSPHHAAGIELGAS